MNTGSVAGRDRPFVVWRLVLVAALLAGAMIGSSSWHPAHAAVPQVTSLSPESGAVSGGTGVTITGSGFDAQTSVAFGSQVVAPADVTVAGDGASLTVEAPARDGLSVGRVEVVVTNDDGSSPASTHFFTYRPEIDTAANNDAHVVLGDLASRSQRGPIIRTTVAPYLTIGTDARSGEQYTYESDFNYAAFSDEAYTYESDERALRAGSALTTSIGTGSYDGRTDVLRMDSGGNCETGNTFDGKTTYCSVFGPEVYTEPFHATDAQALAFDWAATGAGDDYEIYAYLVEVDDPAVSTAIPTDADAHTVVAHAMGAAREWTTATGDIPQDGFYRFRFVNGTFDATGGYLIGSEMFIDDVILVGLKNSITFPQIGDQVLEIGDTLELPTVTADSGEPVDVVSGNTAVCTLAGTTITIEGVGTCTLQASQGATGDYAPAATVNRSFQVREQATTPGAPTLTGITPGAGELEVAFLPPGSDGGAAITNYEYSLDGGATWTASSPATTTSPLTITGLDDTPYDVAIRAVNSEGDGDASNTITATPDAPPPPPPPPAPDDEDAGPEPVLDEEGRLPPPGTGGSDVGGERRDLELVRDDDGVTATGDGFTIRVADPADDGDPATGPSPSDVRPILQQGSRSVISVTGFRPGSPVSVWLVPDFTELGGFDVDASGAATALTEPLPFGTTACQHTLHVEGELPSGEQVRASIGVWVDAATGHFDDVARSHTHRRAIDCLADLGIVQGTSLDAYAPGGTLTRGQAASILATLMGLETDGSATFADAVGTTHEGAIAAVVEAGWAVGTGTDTFGPAELVSRGQLASLIANALGLADGDPDAFTDAGVTHGPAIAALVDVGILHGYPDGTVRPSDPVTRAQAASMYVRVLPLLETEGE